MGRHALLEIPRVPTGAFSEFRLQADLLLGRTDPVGKVTVFDAKELGESAEGVTLVHERTHQMLFRLTALGHLVNCLWQFVKAGHYKQEYNLFLQEQATIQELTAYYVSLSWSARRSPAKYDDTWSKTLQKYRSVVEPVLNILPLKDESDSKRLLARGLIVEAVARCAFNNGCLGTFSDPEQLRVDVIRQYLDTQSSHRRFLSIFNSLIVSPGLDELERKLLDLLAPSEEEGIADRGLKWLLWAIPSMLPRDIFVANVIQIVGQLFRFAEGWKEKAHVLNVTLSLPGPSLPEPEIVPSPEYLDSVRQQITAPRPIRKEGLQLLFELVKPDHPEIYVWIYMRQTDEVFLSVFFCGADDEGHPRLDAFARFESGSDVVEGVMQTEDVFRVLDSAPRGSIVATFYRSSWLHWNVVCKERQFGAFAKIGCIEVELTKESLGQILAFREFYKFHRRSAWFGSDFGKDLRMGYLVSAERANAFAIVRLGSNVAANVFIKFVQDNQIPPATPDLVKQKRMLEVASMPIWAQLEHGREKSGHE